MKAHSLALFPTTVVQIDEFLTEEECRTLANIAVQENLAVHGALIGDGVSNHTAKSDFLGEVSENIRQKLSVLLDAYVTDLGIEKVKIVNSWVNIQKQGSYLKDHVHAGSAVSGALFINVDEQSSPLCFINPNPHPQNMNIVENTEFSSHVYGIQPKNGMLVMFPSWLKHGSNNIENWSENRIVLSFNATYIE